MELNTNVRWKARTKSGKLQRLSETDARLTDYVFMPRIDACHTLVLRSGLRTHWGEHVITARTVMGCIQILATVEPCDCDQCEKGTNGNKI